MTDSSNDWVADRLDRWRAKHDADAFGELLKWQRDRAYSTARSIVGAADAEDAVQQAFAKLLTRTSAFEDADTFRVAVYRCVVQESIDLLRKRRSERKMESAMQQTPREHSPSPLRNAEKAEVTAALRQELANVPDDTDRAAVVLCCQEGLSVYETARTLNVPRETLRYRIKTALASLRSALERRGFMISALLLVELLHQSGACAATPKLCVALDGNLPGAKCADVVPDSFASNAARVLTDVSGAASKMALIAGVAAVVLFVAAVGLFSSGMLANKPPETAKPEKTAPASEAKNAAVPVLAETEGKKSTQPAAPTAPAADVTMPRFNGVPDEICRAAARALPGITLLKAKVETDHGQPEYEFIGRTADGFHEITVSNTGKVLEVKIADDDDVGDLKEKPVQTPAPAGDF